MKTQKFFLNFKKSFFLFLFFLIIFFANFFWGDNLKNFIFKIFSPLQIFLWEKFSFINFLPEKISEIRNLQRENQNLKRENLELKATVEKLKEEKKECNFLKDDFEKNTQNLEYIIAKVVAKTTDSDTLLINKGKENGVFEGEVVLGKGKVLLGKIEKVYENFSKLKLISSKGFKVLVRKENSDQDFLLEGKGNLELILNFVPKDSKLEVGEKIFTSPSQTHFPPQILIGEIKEIIKKETLPFQQAKIKPYFDLEFVYLVKNFKPWTEK